MRLRSSLVAMFALTPLVSACSASAPAGGTPDDRDADLLRADASELLTDAGSDAGEGTSTKTTALEIVVGDVTRTVTRAQFGTGSSDGGGVIRVEAHEGGDPACPTETSPTPKRTVIVDNVPATAPPGATFTKEKDGVVVSIVDFSGDQLPDNPAAAAIAAKVTVVAIATSSIEIEVDATLESGTIRGRAYATYCESLTVK